MNLCEWCKIGHVKPRGKRFCSRLCATRWIRSKPEICAIDRRRTGEKAVALAAAFGVTPTCIVTLCKHPDRSWRFA